MGETSNGKYIEGRKGRDGDYKQIRENRSLPFRIEPVHELRGRAHLERNSETMRTDA